MRRKRVQQKRVLLKIKFIKYSCVVFLICFLVFLHKKDEIRDVSMDTIKEQMKFDKVEAVMKKGEKKDLRKYYNLDEQLLEGYILYIPSEIMSVEEVFIAKVKDKNHMTTVKKTVEERLENQKKSFANYGVGQTAILNKAKLEVKGKYIFFAVSENAADWKKNFDSIIE